PGNGLGCSTGTLNGNRPPRQRENGPDRVILPETTGDDHRRFGARSGPPGFRPERPRFRGGSAVRSPTPRMDGPDGRRVTVIVPFPSNRRSPFFPVNRLNPFLRYSRRLVRPILLQSIRTSWAAVGDTHRPIRPKDSGLPAKELRSCIR